MTESQSVLKSDYNSACNRLVDLPLSIIYTILSSLPIKEAVRTSILSREWRYTWTGLPKLEFISNAEGIKDEERLKEFISYALSVHKGSLHKFILDLVFEEPHLDEWVICLSTKDIRELSLIPKCTSNLSGHSSISSIYSCNKLTRLRLEWCKMGPPPFTFNGFPFLRNLTLNGVMISSAAFESLVSNSPLLERLIVDQYRKLVNNSIVRVNAPNLIVRVNAPNLKYLKLLGCWTEMSMNAPLLATIYIVLRDNELHGANRTEMSTNAPLLGPLCNYTNFLGGCTNLEELNGFGLFTQVMSIGMESWNLNPLVFNCLTTILLNDVDFRDIKQQIVFARLLVAAPNLRNLTIVGRLQPWITQDTDFTGFGFKSNFRMEKLRVVKMLKVRGLIPEIKLIQILLERSPLLEMMSVCHATRRGNPEINVRDTILGCTRASQTAEISVSPCGY